MKKVSILTFAICLSCVVLAGCSGENSSKTESASSQSSETTEAGETKMPDTTAAIESTTAAETTESNGSSSLVGSWEYADGGFTYTFNANGTGTYDAYGSVMNFTYTDNGASIEFTYEDVAAPTVLEYTIDGDTLIMKDSFGSDVTYIKK